MKEWFISNLEWICALAITIIFSVINIILAVCNLKIIKNQNKMQNDAFCFQLYEKRMAIYESIDHIIVRVGQNGRVENKDTQDYIVAAKDIEFMFGADVIQVSNAIYNTLNELCRLTTLIEGHREGINQNPDHKENCDRQYALKQQLSTQKKQLKECMKRYISFEAYRVQPRKSK